MAYTTINKSTDYFNTKIWTGTGSSNAITGVGFQPDFCWVKSRSLSENHFLNNAINGSTKVLQSDTAAAEQTSSNGMTAFNSDGFTVNTDTGFNGNGATYASWNWKANGQGSSNTDGSINTTYTSANTTSGFSISKYGGNGTQFATVGHGLGVAPNVIMIKNLTGTTGWIVYHDKAGLTGSTLDGEAEYKMLSLNTTDAASDNGSDCIWGSTSTRYKIDATGSASYLNSSGSNYIAYCFAEKKGFSKFGSVKGNGSDDGPFIYTGFKPAFYMHKVYNGATGQWLMFDNKRNETNVVNKFLKTDANEAEGTSGSANQVDFLSNGIKIRENNGDLNGSTSNDYLYLAFAEAPLVGSNNVPANAR